MRCHAHRSVFRYFLRKEFTMSCEFGERVRIARENCGYSQAALAEMIGMSTNHISAIERGLYEPRVSTLASLAGVLGESADYLLFGTPGDRSRLSRLFRRVASLPEDEQSRFADYIDALFTIRIMRKWQRL